MEYKPCSAWNRALLITVWNDFFAFAYLICYVVSGYMLQAFRNLWTYLERFWLVMFSLQIMAANVTHSQNSYLNLRPGKCLQSRLVKGRAMTTSSFTLKPVSRRDFLRASMLAGLGLLGTSSLVGCAPDAASSSTAGSDSAKTVNVITYNGNPPYCYLDSDGNLVGYDVDVLKAVDERLDEYAFDIDSMDFDAMVTACESGSAELVSCQLVPTEERKEKFIFCEEPLCLTPIVFAVRDPEIKTMEDMAGKTAASNPINYAYGLIEDYNEKYPDKAINLQAVSQLTMADAFKMVASGQIDAFPTLQSSFDTINEQAGTNLYASDVVMCVPTYFMFNENQAELRDAVDKALAEMKSDGSLKDIEIEDLGVDVFEEYKDLPSGI